jgi:hypothetical protein
MMRHSIYGLSIKSDLPLPGVPESPSAEEPDVHVILGRLPHGMSGTDAHTCVFPKSGVRVDAERPALKVRRFLESGDFWLTYEDGAEFVVDRFGIQVWACWPESLTLDDVCTYLLGPVIGFVLRLRGVTCLHASAVEVDGQGLAILGPPGAGKSTLAAGFANAGFAVLSDDVAPVLNRRGGFAVQPGYPRLRLWPDSVQALYGSVDLLPRITPTWDKRHLDLTDCRYRFLDRPAPLSAVYVLDERTDGAPVIEAMRPRDAVLALVANTYANYLLDADMRAQEFGELQTLATLVPLRRVQPASDISLTPELCNAIVRDLSQV